MMKVLHIINCFTCSGGAEKLVADLVRAMSRKGVLVEILSLTAPVGESDDFVGMARSEGIQVHFLTRGSVYSLKNIGRLYCFFKSHSYDIIHVHLFPAFYFCAIAKIKGMILCFTEHSTMNRRRHNYFLKFADRWAYARYEHIVCISGKVRESLIGQIGEASAAVIPNGICLDDFFNASPLSVDVLIGEQKEGIRIITMCARFFEGKDYKTLFRALKLLPDFVHVLCVGDGVQRKEHEQYCRESGLIDKIHFLGLRKDVNRIFKSSDVIVLSSAYEGFSLSMLEAMASGNPLIASDVPGISDLISDCAVLFPYGNEKILAENILKLLEDDEYRNKVVEKEMAFAARYDIASVADQYIQLYNKNQKDEK